MAFVTADVVSDPGNDPPFKVVFMQGKTVIAEWPVESVKDGEQEIVEFIKSSMEEDDDEEDDDDDEESGNDNEAAGGGRK